MPADLTNVALLPGVTERDVDEARLTHAALDFAKVYREVIIIGIDHDGEVRVSWPDIPFPDLIDMIHKAQNRIVMENQEKLDERRAERQRAKKTPQAKPAIWTEDDLA